MRLPKKRSVRVLLRLTLGVLQKFYGSVGSMGSTEALFRALSGFGCFGFQGSGCRMPESSSQGLGGVGFSKLSVCHLRSGGCKRLAMIARSIITLSFFSSTRDHNIPKSLKRSNSAIIKTVKS